MRRGVAAAAAAVLVALGAGVVSIREVGRQMAALDACAAAGRGDWEAALAGTEGRVGSDATGLAAAECRCRALLASGRGGECTALLDELLEDPDTRGWAPAPDLSVHVVQARRNRGRADAARRLARRAALAHPDDPDLFYLELATRAPVEEEGLLLEELAARVPSEGPEAVRMRSTLANRYLLRGEPDRALEALGSVPPRGSGDAIGLWFETRGIAYASAGDVAGVERTYSRWRAVGGDPRELQGRHALTLSLGNLQGPQGDTLSLIERALESGVGDAELEERLHVRRILTLVALERVDEALDAFDRARATYPLEGLTRDELVRSAMHRRLADGEALGEPFRLHFAVPRTDGGARLAISPPPGEALDGPYRELPISAEGAASVERLPDLAPVRWVLRDASERTLASGTANPLPGSDHRVAVALREPAARERVAIARRDGDGRRRIALVLLDCGDWRIVQYLRARGELPVLTELLESGYRGVLRSDPPLTAAALEALVWPSRETTGVIGLVHQMGLELAGLASVGENPFGALAWLLPEAPDLFEVVGAGDRAAANLLFAHGGIRAGRHGEVTGPNGERRRVAMGAAERDLDADERRRFPTLAAVERERDAIHLRTIAAELDAAEQILREGEIDLMALRVEALDILTHAHFAAIAAAGQDDGEGLLYSVYRYIDWRLAGVARALDTDDVLIVMSDHGIRTAMEHSRFAFFVAAGGDVPTGRAEGLPELRGVSRVLADLLGVVTEWPSTGVAPWAARSAAGLARNGAASHPASAH